MSTTPFDIREIGTVLEVRNVVVKIQGLPTCAYGQPLQFSDGSRGVVMGFDKTQVLAILFNDASSVKAGDTVEVKEESLDGPVGEAFIGRIVNGLAEPLDGKGAVEYRQRNTLFAVAPGITERSALKRQLETGIKILDSVIPIAKGQRELIIGDRVTGKTTIGVDTILNQKGKDVVCIYCCVGRGFNFLVKLTQLFQEHGAFAYSMIVASTSDSPVGQQYMAPYTAATLGEYFMRQGRDVLVVFDDLSKHAWVYREISLLMERSPGREAYPGDIFYLHSQLVERAAQLSPELGGGSMTFLPIVETQQGDVTGYISSNLISMTDGQIYLTSELFQEGFKPAVDLGLSVSRIGNKIQTQATRALCGTLRLDYVRYRELLNITKLRSNISAEARAKLKRGEAITAILKQGKNEPVDLLEQVLLYYPLKQGRFDELPLEHIELFKKQFFAFTKEKYFQFLQRLKTQMTLTEAIKTEFDSILNEFFRMNQWPVANP